MALRSFLDYDGTAPTVALANRVDADWLNAVDAMLQSYDTGVARFNVMAYGAVADGVTNTTAAFTNAIAAATAAVVAGAAGAVVYVPAGSYKVTTFTLTAGVLLLGDGPGRTIITGTASTGQIVAVVGVSYAGIVGMTIVGPTTGTVCAPVYVYQSDYTLLRDLVVTGGVFTGMYLAESDFGCLQNVTVSGTKLFGGIGGRGVWLFAGSSSWQAYNLRIADTEGNGLDLDASSPPSTEAACSDSRFTDVWLENTNTALVGSALDLQSAHRNAFANVTLKDCNSAGIAITVDQGANNLGGSNDNVLSGVICYDVAGVELYFFGSQRNRVSNVKIYNATKAAGSHPIHFEATTVSAVDLPCSNNTVDGVDIVATNAYDHPISHVATATVQVAANTARFTRPFTATFNASSVAQASNVVRNVTDLGVLFGSATFNPASLADGEGTTTTVTVTGALLGDMVEAVSFSLDLQGISVTAYVSAADTVSVRFQNESGGVLDLSSGTLRAVVHRYL